MIERDEAHRLVSAGATLLDVRTRDEFAGGHVDGAVNIPVDELPARIGELATDRPVVAYCRSGRRSAHAAVLKLRHLLLPGPAN